MPNNECVVPRGIAGMTGPVATGFGERWGLKGGEKNSKPAMVAVKRDKECVCVGFNWKWGGGSGERDYHWGYLNILEM